MYINICIYVYMYVYLFTYIYIYICMYIYIFIYVSILIPLHDIPSRLQVIRSILNHDCYYNNTASYLPQDGYGAQLCQ
jgi:hypothetical protein